MTIRSRTVDAVFWTLEGVASLYDFVRRFRRAAPIPLTRLSHRDVEHQQAQIRRATIRPPPP